MGRVVAAVVGGLVALGAWLVALPWDLSETGGPSSGGDEHGGAVALVAGLVVVTALGLLGPTRTRRLSAPFAGGGLATWAVLFAWRAGTAETSGANMFLVPLAFVVIPLTIAVPLLLRIVSRRLET